MTSESKALIADQILIRSSLHTVDPRMVANALNALHFRNVFQ